jgi:hypothetical protein
VHVQSVSEQFKPIVERRSPTAFLVCAGAP